MLYFQSYKKSTFEYKFLNQIKNQLSNNIDLKCYFGFDFGFFSGINIYYGSKKENKTANYLADLLKKENINIRLVTNIDYDFDLIVLFCCANLRKEKRILKNNLKKIMKALSFFSKDFKNENIMV